MRTIAHKTMINFIIAVFCFLYSSKFLALTSEDAYINTDGTAWTLGTASVEKTIALEGGMLVTRSFKNRTSGHQLSPAAQQSGTGPWKFVVAKTSKLKQGELQLDLTLQQDSLVVTKTFVIYPSSSIIREWAVLKNAGATPLKISDPDFLNTSVRLGDPVALDFHWMTGGENAHGSWVLKTEKLSAGRPRHFDSYDPFPDQGVCGDVVDGDANTKVLLNGRQIWPVPGREAVQTATGAVPVDTSAQVAKGNKLIFLVNPNPAFDTIVFDPTIAYDDGETHVASKEFSNQQGHNGWLYQYAEGGPLVDLAYDTAESQWRQDKNNALGPFVGAGIQRGGMSQDAARVWTVPKSGKIRITGSTCSVALSGPASTGFRPGSASYAPWVALYDRGAKEGLFIGWDYFGHWDSSYTSNVDGVVAAQLRVAGHTQTLMPGQSITTPKAFIGLFQGDIDNAGNELLDWQYRYLWDYTRDGWFPGIRMLGYWWKGTGWMQPGVGWTGGNPDLNSTFRKVFRLADMMRYVGADVYHRDWGWWDRAGDWNGPDFRTMGNYLRKYDMGQLIYAFLYTVDLQSKVSREHPDWVLTNLVPGTPPELIAGTLDMSRPEVVMFMKGQLDTFAEQWGDFEWRNDSFPTSQKNGDDTPLLGQDQGMREVLQGFLDKHPRSAFQAVNGGGNYAGYDYTRYASAIQFSDAAVGLMRNYWASLLLPPDKISDNPDAWRNVDKFDKAHWRGWLCLNFDTVGDTWDLSKLEGLRELIDIYHYLQGKGVVGRWVHVYRPVVTGDDPTMYFQRLSKDAMRGIIIPKRPSPGAVTIKPKGLLPKEKYVVSYHESGNSEVRAGADLMEKGVELQKMAPGELIYLNLPMHPGSKLDTEEPKPASHVVKRRGENMGYPGIEVGWEPGFDNNWVSYYQIFRNGVAIDKVAKGTFYFDHSAGADLAATYEVQTVDGAGNVSAKRAAQGSAAKPSRIIDDALGGGITFSPQWQHASAPPLVAYNGTTTSTNEKGAAAEVAFEGKRVLLFSKLGANNGKAAVSIDGGAAEIVDTYSADDIWGVSVYQKEFSAAGRHTIRVEVLGDRNLRSKDAFITVDGIRVEME